MKLRKLNNETTTCFSIYSVFRIVSKGRDYVLADKNNNRLVWMNFSEGLARGFKVVMLPLSTLPDDAIPSFRDFGYSTWPFVNTHIRKCALYWDFCDCES